MPNNQRALIIGAGPSVKEKKHLETLKKTGFDGTIITTDRMLKPCIALGIHPHYIVTLEEGNRWQMEFFDIGIKHELESVVIHAKRVNQRILEQITKNGLVYHQFDESFYNTRDTTNCGLFGVIFAYKMLGIQDVYLIGFDHAGPEHEFAKFAEWKMDFLIFLDQNPRLIVTNCTEGGILYADNILKQKFELIL